MDSFEGLNRFEKEELFKHLKISWTYNSNAIEGNSLNYSDTQFVIENGLTVKGKPLKDHTEVIGHAKAVDLISEFVQNNTFTQENLFILHKAIQTNIVVDIECPIGAYKVVENGRYIKVDNELKYLPYPHPDVIPFLMNLWFEEFGMIATCDIFDHCVEIYTDIHLSFTSIHPFFDGNGRLARLIANLPLLKSGYLPLIIANEDRQEYIQLLAAYNIATKELDKNALRLVEKNEQYQNLKEFFKQQYKNSQKLLDTIKEAKR